MASPLWHALIAASRFGLLLGLGLWLGLVAAAVAQLPLLARRAGAPGAPPAIGELVAALMRRTELLLFVAMLLVVTGLAARVILDRAAPPTGLLVPVAAMTLARLLGALAVSPSVRALRTRVANVEAPATPGERTAFSRLDAARRVLLTLELCLALYALFAIA